MPTEFLESRLMSILTLLVVSLNRFSKFDCEVLFIVIGVVKVLGSAAVILQEAASVLLARVAAKSLKTKVSLAVNRGRVTVLSALAIAEVEKM